MKILIEEKVPFLHGVFEPYAHVRYLPASAISAAELEDTDALITRTRPKLNEENLKDSALKIIATATIGTDHIDLDYCRNRGIKVINAPGCNAPGVAQWVFASLNLFNQEKRSGKCLAVVGVGNVGKIVSRWGKALGYEVLEIDPPRAKAEGSSGFSTLEQACRDADFITFHTPLTSQGDFPTYHMANAEFFSKLRRKPVVLNAARGAVVHTEALKDALRNGLVSHSMIDCWENEPNIDRELLRMSLVSTPHIAGYSLEGKIRASVAAVNAVASHFNLEIDTEKIVPLDKNGNRIKINDIMGNNITSDVINRTYSPLKDSVLLKKNPKCFEMFRDSYDYRREPFT